MNFKMLELMKTARMLMGTCMGVKSDENVLILTDTAMDFAIAESMASAVAEFDGNPFVVIKKPPKIPNEELPKALINAVKGSDVFISIMSKTCGTQVESVKTAMLEYGTRVLHATGLTPDKMTDPAIADVDYEEMTELSRKLFKIGAGKKIKITSKTGCDFSADLVDYYGVEAGIARDIGGLCVLPAGQPAWGAAEKTANGILVFDEFPFLFQNLSAPIKMTVKDNWVTKVDGGKEAPIIEKFIKSMKNANFIGEIGLGMNPYAKIRTPPLSIFEGTRVKGALVIGVGHALGFGLRIASPSHQDGLTFKPTIEIDGKVIVDEGKIKI